MAVTLNTQNVEIFINNQITEAGAKELANLYNNFISNRRKISNKITRFINKGIKNKILQIHCDNYNYILTSSSELQLQFFKEGYKIINEVRELLGLEPTEYLVGILDEINGKAYQVQMQEGEFLKYARSRGADRMALSHSMRTVNELMEKADPSKGGYGQDITDGFVNKFLPIIEKRTKTDSFDLNYGYAFEAYGHVKQVDGSKNNRHDIYYNYYRESRKNNNPWVTGGDIGALQYKLIRVYKNDKGNTVISSASISSVDTIIAEMSFLKEMLNNSSSISPSEMSYSLAKHFTQLGVPKELTKSLREQAEEAIKPYLKTYKS